MQRPSPPKHRHDGTSPLPLGMDWSPPPRKWNGRDTVWPHASRTGWSYCVAIPSWVVLPKSRDSDPVVFYRVHVGVQSPDAVTTTRGVLRRFNDFLRLFTDLKKVFPKKAIPSTPPKGLLRMKSRTLLEERRRSLEEWMTKLLSDIDISRSAAVASFLELEVAARTSFQDVNSQTLETNPHDLATQSMSPTVVGTSQSITSDYGSDTAYEISDIGTPTLGRDDSSEIGLDDLKLDEDLTGPIEKLVKYGMTNIDEGLFMGQTILEQLEGLPRNKVPARNFNRVPGKDVYSENGSKASFLSANGMDLFSEAEISRVIAHARKISNESVGSDVSSMRGSEISNYGIPNSSGGSLDLLGGGEISSSMETIGNSELHGSGGPQLILPLDQRNKMNRILSTLQRRLVTAKTDMEDLIARLYQEIAVKDYLATKVKDLEVELEADRQKSKENLQQAIMIERERVTRMQWDMEELRQKSIEMEVKLKSKSEKDNKTSIESSPKNSSDSETVVLLNDLDSSKQLETLSKQYEELVVKSKADRKVLVKEVKSLRSSLAKMEHELSKSVQEKSEAEKLSQQEKQKSKQAETAKKNLLHKCKTLHDQLLECTLKFPQDEDVDKDKVSLYPVSPVEALDLLATSDDQISVLFSEAKLLSHENRASDFDLDENRESMINYGTADDELRKILSDIVIENIKLRKRVNCVLYTVTKYDPSNAAEDGL